MVVKKTKKLALAMIISCLDGVRYPGKSIVGSIYVSTPSYNICQCPLILIHFSRFQWRYTHKLHIHSTERERHTHRDTGLRKSYLLETRSSSLLLFFHAVRRSRAVSGTTLEFFCFPNLSLAPPPQPNSTPPKKERNNTCEQRIQRPREWEQK